MLVCKSNPIFEGGTSVTERTATAAAMCIVNLATAQGAHAAPRARRLATVQLRCGPRIRPAKTDHIFRGLYIQPDGRALISEPAELSSDFQNSD